MWWQRTMVIGMVGWLAGCAGRTDGPGATDAPAAGAGINDPYRAQPVSEWVERFEREGREVYDQRAALLQECELAAGDVVADVGAGTGLFTRLLSDAVGPDGVVYAVDIMPGFIEHIRTEVIAGEERTNVRAVLCSERSVELPPESIDVAWVCDTYHHFEHPLASTRSIYDALRPGGRLVVVDFERIPGVSSDWVMGHVRAGRLTVINEILSCGFEALREQPRYANLADNYLLVFRKPERGG